MENILKIESIEKYYGNKSSLTKAINNISLQVEKGEFVAIMGASGSGKTTLLNCISTIDKVTSGNIYVAGRNITNLNGKELNKFRREELGFIFQDFYLMNSLSVEENIMLPMMIAKSAPEEMRKRAAAYATQFEIAHLLKKYPYELSGGEQQRVAIARALVNNPSTIVADEPTGNLDPNRSLEIMTLLERINALGTTVVVVTHERDLVNHFDKRVIMIDHGQVNGDGVGTYEV